MILLSVLVYRKTFGEEADFYGKKNFESMRKVMRKEMRFLYIFLFEKVPIRFCKTDRQKCLFFTGLAYLTHFLISYFYNKNIDIYKEKEFTVPKQVFVAVIQYIRNSRCFSFS